MKKGIITIVGILTGCWAFGQSVHVPLSVITGFESIAIGIVFKLVFIAQIFGLSFFLPQFIARKAVKNEENSGHGQVDVTRYTIMNNVSVVIGFVVLALITFHPAFSSVTAILLMIGIYFIIQLLPIMLNNQLTECQYVNVPNKNPLTLFETVHPVIVGIATILFLSYLTVSLITWDGSLNTRLLQIAIFIGANTSLVLFIRKSFQKLKQLGGEERQKQMSNLMKVVPTFLYISIGISMYYFGKMFLLDYGLHELRPVLMSLALLLLGFLINNQVSKYITSEE